MILKDINNTTVSSFQIDNDGIVYGYIGQPGTGYKTASLNNESCSALNFFFRNNGCYWASTNYDGEFGTKFDSDYKINIKKSDVGDLPLILTLEYLIEIDIAKLEMLGSGVLGENLKKMEVHFNLFREDTSIFSTPLFVGVELERYLTQGPGIFCINYTDLQRIANEILLSTGILPIPSRLVDDWIESSYNINDSMDTNYSTDLRIGITVDNYFEGVNVKFNQIKIEGKGEQEINKVIIYDKNPSFEIERKIDNKKSWDPTKSQRFHENKNRQTNYSIESEGHVLNSKELDVSLKPGNTFLHELWNNVKSDRKYLTASQYNMSTTLLVSKLFQDLSDQDIDTIDEFKKYLFERYVNSRNNRVKDKYSLLIGIFIYNMRGTSGVNFFKNSLEKSMRVDKYWMDVIQEFIPSTSIWESGIRIGNSGLNDNSLKYQSYSLNYRTVNSNPVAGTMLVDTVMYDGITSTHTKNVTVYSNSVSFAGIQEYPISIKITQNGATKD